MTATQLFYATYRHPDLDPLRFTLLWQEKEGLIQPVWAVATVFSLPDQDPQFILPKWLQGMIISRKIADALRGQLQTYPVWGREVAWSPDGRYLVVPSGNQLQVLEVNSGEVKQLDDFKRYPLGHFTWRPDSQELVWEKEIKDDNSGPRIELWSWHVTGGTLARRKE